MECKQVVSALDSLRLFPIETSVLNATLTSLWCSLSQDSWSLVERYKRAEAENIDVSELNKEASQLHDVIQLTKRSIIKLTSKSDLAEVITKRAKVMEELLQIEQKLESLRSPLAKKSPKMTAAFNFTAHLDVLGSIDLLLHLRQSVALSNDPSKQEHLGTITSLVDFLNAQRPNNPCQTPIWPMETLHRVATLEMHQFLGNRLDALSDDEDGNDEDRSGSGHAKAAGYGTALRGLWQGLPMLVKKVNPNVFHRSQLGLKEAIALLEINSPFLSESPFLNPVVGVSWEADHSALYLLSPLAPHLSLFDAFSNPLLKADAKLPLNHLQKASILCDVAAGVAHLHRHGVTHGRLKDSNVLLFDGYRAKLSDFGVHTFLANSSRRELQGKHGIRWHPPEVAQLHRYLEATDSEPSSTGTPPTLETIAAGFPFPVATPVDVYAIGVLAIVLMTERPPFANVPWDEGVATQLLQFHVPTLPTQFKEKETMGLLADALVSPCCAIHPGDRPSAEEVMHKAEEAFVRIVRMDDEREFKEFSETIITLQQEIEELNQKIGEHEVLVKRGHDLIAKKDMEKRKTTEAKVRREKELELERARVRLQGFEEELQGLQEDKDGADSDLLEVFALRDEAELKMRRDKEEFMAERPPESVSLPVSSALLRTYFTIRETELYAAQILPALRSDSGTPAAVDLAQVRSFVWAPSIVAQSPFASVNEPLRDLDDAQLHALQDLVARRCSPYEDLVQEIELIFRVPISAKSLKASSQSIYVQNLVRPVSSTVSASLGERNSLPGMAMVSKPAAVVPEEARTISIMSEISTMPHRLIRDAGVVDSDDDVDAVTSTSFARRRSSAYRYSQYNPHAGMAPMLPHHASVAVSAYANYYAGQDRAVPGATGAGFGPGSATGAGTGIEAGGRTGAAEGCVQLTSIPFDAPWDLPISPPMIANPDNFPESDYEIIHVQFLAASRGDWQEAVGMRRHGQSFSDETIADYLDRNVTPLHVAAMFGNLKIFRELIEGGGLIPMALDQDGSTPLHYACSRGHLSIAKYLCEDHGFPADQTNSKGLSPVLYALKGGYLDVIVYFIEQCPQPISPHYEDSQLGASLVHWACLGGNLELVSYLLYQQYVSVEQTAKVDGSTPLLWACFGGSKELVQFLVERAQADRHVRNDLGQSCLHMATMSGDADKTIYLLEAGLKVSDKDGSHLSAFDVAEGAAKMLLADRMEKGFVTGSIVDRMVKKKPKAGSISADRRDSSESSAK